MVQERAWDPWDEPAYQALFDALNEGLSDAELMERLGRTAGALSSRARKLLAALLVLDPEAVIPGRGLNGLRDLICGESDQDWMPLAREAHKIDGQMFWGSHEDNELTRAWEAQTETISAIASRLGTGDMVVVERLVRLGLAQDLKGAVGRLGVAPGSLLDVRQRIADGNTVEQWVLAFSDAEGRVLDISIHANETDARQAIDWKRERVLRHADLYVARWTLACRVMGLDNADTFESDVVSHLAETQEGAPW
ncbi:MAG: hypothetical protein LBE44_03285 [Microbacterium hominis]|jgi:hypothetical protein|uniref:hypothetical protein n=1 Tax=Microbacterium aurum TaxID=36805 RepID=UPI00248EAD9B|nr:hypothetical protein [Microbacterium aurum]MBZ6370930.1 hypothetical protein [Microbacterium hominis]